MITKEQYIKALHAKEMNDAFGVPTDSRILDIIAEYEEQMKAGAGTPIYTVLKAENKYGVSDEKAKCVEETVEELLSTAENASDPGLLLGKIQCGKTDTFEMIIGLALDKGFDVAVILTKNSNALAYQTVTRLKGDYRHFTGAIKNPGDTRVVIQDIMKEKDHLASNLKNNAKIILVVKKEATNMRHLINLFSQEKNSWLKEKKVLIVDDEADFASRNYRSVRLSAMYDNEGNPVVQDAQTDMAVISKQIDEFRTIPYFCRYLQVTATPYCLLLQPDEKIQIVDGEALCFRPRFTKLVPVHNGYIGGQQYFVDRKDSESMFSHLYVEVAQNCVDLLGSTNKEALKYKIKSIKLSGLTRALMAYLMATAIRRIQSGPLYTSSAVVHVSTAKNEHKWQAKVINMVLCELRKYFELPVGQNDFIDGIFQEIYEDFKESTLKGIVKGKELYDADDNLIYSEKLNVEMPSDHEVRNEVNEIFNQNSHAIDEFVKVVNSDEDLQRLIDEETGQLRIDNAINIFVGGNNLDRGITINNMLCFFYGRDPKTFQQDTVLQHARFYGARSLEDMAVTRLYTTKDIYQALEVMNELDEDLRNRFLNSSNNDIAVSFVGYDDKIRPCAVSKIAPSKTINISGHRNFVPKGMQTGTKEEISATIAEIDSLIGEAASKVTKDSNGFFVMDARVAMRILELIESTYRYGDSYNNLLQKRDMEQLRAVLAYCADKSYGKILALHAVDRNMSRTRKNGGWIDSPADGNYHLKPAKLISEHVPVLILLRENGKKENGWNNTPFYWPLLHTQGDLAPVLFASGIKSAGQVVVNSLDELLKGLNIKPEEILSLTFSGNLSERFGSEGTVYEIPKEYETRAIRKTNWGTYLKKDLSGSGVAYAEGVNEETDITAGVYSYNGGRFPFELRNYKYLVLRKGRAATEAMLLKLFPKDEWIIEPHQDFDAKGDLYDCVTPTTRLFNCHDVIMGCNGEGKVIEYRDICQWVIHYPIQEVVRHVSFKQPVEDLDTEE